MRQISGALLLLLIVSLAGKAQEVAVKTNLLYDATTTLNLGVEVGLAEQWTLDLSGNYNPWTLGGGKKLRHWAIQPEARYWTKQRFGGHFVGAHLLAGGYNVGGIRLLGLRNERHQGHLYGAGLAYGYRWLLKGNWGMEASLGLGYIHLTYDKYPCGNCGKKLGEGTTNYFGPTKAALSLIYTFK